MFSSLRVRLPLLFLLGIVLAGTITTAIAIRLFQDFSHAQTVSDLRRQADGIATLYTEAIEADFNPGGADSRKAPTFARTSLELATGSRIYYVGVPPFPGEKSGLPTLPESKIDWQSGKMLTFEFVPPGAKNVFIAVAAPVEPRKTPVGAIVVARQKTDISASVWALIRRLAVAGIFGLLVAGVLALYVSRRLVGPVLGLSHAADEVAAGHYDTPVPVRGAGEIGHLAERFSEMAERLAEAETHERNFLMSVSHELRTPLTAIRGHVSAILEGVVDDPETQALSLGVVEAEAQRLERLVGDIIDLAKLDTHRFTVHHEEVDLGQLVQQAFETFGDEARRRSIAYRLTVDDAPVIVSDGDRVLQIVANLLSNAFRATHNGGTVGLSLARENGSVHIRVRDTGPGISLEQRELIFRPFVSGADGGTGLGLTIARELATALGGRLDLESTVGLGSTFDLVLPVSD